MAKARYANRRDYPKRLVEGRSSRYVCRWCGKRLPGKRSNYCDAACHAEVDVRCGWDVGGHVSRRDHGVCARCGLDTVALKARLRKALKRHKRRLSPAYPDRYPLQLIRGGRPKWYERLCRFWKRVGLTPRAAMRSLWEAHHILAAEDQAAPCGLDGYETLCIWCHRSETAQQRGDKAKARREERQAQLPLLKEKK